MNLEGKSAVITGAGRGIGRAIALEYARRGARVTLASRTESQLAETLRLIEAESGKAVVAVTDVRDQGSVEAMVRTAESSFGPVDVLVNNAGSFATIGPVADVDPEAWWNDVTVNLLGTFLCCRAVLPSMTRRSAGIIINLIGGGTATPFPYGSAYGSSKAAVMRFSESLAAEVKDQGISVFPMGPGLVRTAMTEYQIQTPEGRTWLGRIEELFDQHKDRPPEDAAVLAVTLGSGAYADFTGRAFGAGDDLAVVERDKQKILDEDLRTLRMR